MGENSRQLAGKPKKKKSILKEQMTNCSKKSKVHRILSLQKTMGNRAVQRMMGSGTLQNEQCVECTAKLQKQPEEQEEEPVCEARTQMKLSVGNPTDVYEQEAERVAEQVSNNNFFSNISYYIQQNLISNIDVPRLMGFFEINRNEISSRQNNITRTLRIFRENSSIQESIVPSSIENRIIKSKGKGSSLLPSIQKTLEFQTGYDFSNVRVKTDSESAKLNRSLGARAFTNGSDIWLGGNESVTDIKLMAHELTHVVQQGAAKKINPKREPIFNKIKSKSKVKDHFQSMMNGVSSKSLYRKDILQFKNDNSPEQITELQNKILELPDSTSIGLKENSQTLRGCIPGCSSGSSPAPCAVPVNFRQTVGKDAGSGILHFEYKWDSSTGSLADLNKCEFGEHVSYTQTEHPPFKPAPNPTIIWIPAKNGIAQDNHSPGVVKPYKNSTEKATQYYRYKCPCKNSGKPVNLKGPVSIVREVKKKNGDYKYKITKSGKKAEIDPLP